MLHLSKVAVACASLDALHERMRDRAAGGEVTVVTRLMPKRADELIGGSLFWIIKHRLVARQEILGFAAQEADRRTIIRLDARLVTVRMKPRTVHQGWRYFAAEDAPPDLHQADGDMLSLLPPQLAMELAGLALI